MRQPTTISPASFRQLTTLVYSVRDKVLRHDVLIKLLLGITTIQAAGIWTLVGIMLKD